MKSFAACPLASCALFTIIAGTSTAYAQAPTVSPTLVYPRLNLPPAQDSISIDDGEVALLPVPNATKYDICVKSIDNREGGACYFRKTFNVTESVAGANGAIRFFVQIPADKQNTEGLWTAAACNNNNQCSPGASFEQFIVLPRQATATEPTGSATIPSNRSVTFRWTNNIVPAPGIQANAGTQLIILPNGPPHLSGFSGANPTVVPPDGLSFQVNQGTNSQIVNLPPGIPSIRWTVGTCHNFSNKGRRCTSRYTTWRTMRIANFFGVAMAPAFRHARCVNCHAVVPDGFANDPQTDGNGGLPFGHFSANATMNNQSQQDGQGCRSCHRDNLLPTQGNINPGWHAPSGMDFRGKSDAQLCQMAKAFPSAGAAFQHLNQDKLILWAVGDGRTPGGPQPIAPPGSILNWQRLIYSWHTARQPCN